MERERWKQVDGLLQSALKVPSGERTAFVRLACEGDSALEHEVQSLLISQREIDGFLDRPAFEIAAEEMARGDREQVLAFDAQPGQSIGPYRLIEPLGTGGMGEVWRAEQGDPIRRAVALKLIKPGMDTRAVVSRFDSERQALAMMDHPNIARVFDAGATPAGRPFFVMELVPGAPITSYCDEHRLTIRRRLLLFLQVCDGVQHAHQKAIIHRDLKPSNILVEEIDGKPMPKIIDFGLAKAITEDGPARSVFTEAGMMIGTPSYMSPEQAGTLNGTIDTRADVYSLGVILFELLVGVAPFASEYVRRSGAEARLRQVREDEAPRPSAKFAALGAVSQDAASARGERPAALLRQLRGDLDWITLKAIEKDRDRRYASVSELAADVRRHLEHQPVLAGAPSAPYRARKFVRRHRVAVAIAGVAAAAAIGVAANIIVQTRRVARERDRAVEESKRADREAAIAKAVNDFLRNDILGQANARVQGAPNIKPDPNLKVSVALDRASALITGKFDSQPLVEAAIRKSIGGAYRDMGFLEKAQEQLEQAVVLTRRALGPDHADTLDSMDELWALYSYQGKYALAEPLVTKVLETRRRLLGPNHKDTIGAMHNVAYIAAYQGDRVRAAALMAEVLEAERRVQGEENRDTLTVMHNLAVQYRALGRFPEAETLFRRAFELRSRVLGPAHPSTLGSLHSLGMTYVSEGRFSEAQSTLMAALQTRRQTLGDENWETLRSLHGLGILYRAEGRYSEAESLLSRTLATRLRVLGAEHPETLEAMSDLAEVYQRQGRLAKAASTFNKVLEARRRLLGPDHPGTNDVLASLGNIKLAQRNYADAEKLLRDALQIRKQKGPDAWERYYTESMLGASLWGLGQYCEARPLLTSGYDGMLRHQSSIPVEDLPALKQARAWVSQP